MATQLLQLALTLLVAASGPNVTPELRAQAISTATYAIQYSQSQQVSRETFSSVSQATTTPKITGPGYWGDDGCFYPRIAGSTKKIGGHPTYCPK